MFQQFNYQHIVDVQSPSLDTSTPAVDITYLDGIKPKTKRVAASINDEVNLTDYVVDQLKKLSREKISIETFKHDMLHVISGLVMKIIQSSSKKPNLIIISQNIFSTLLHEWITLIDYVDHLEFLVTDRVDNLVIMGYKGTVTGDACYFVKSNVVKTGFYQYNADKTFNVLEIENV